MTHVKWLERPQEHDYTAADTYLRLTHKPSEARALSRKLEKAKMTEFAAKDIFRASGLSLLGVSNGHVKKDRAAIDRGDALSPLLLRRDAENAKVIIADGYHRLCAVYAVDEDAIIPCKIV